MTQDTKLQKHLWSLFDSLMGSVGYYNLFSNAVHLIFLKYLISYGDRFEFLGVDSFKAIAAFKRRYDAARSGGEPLYAGDVHELFYALDSERVFGDVRLSECLNGYDALFEDRQNQRTIIRILEEFEIDYSKDFLGSFFELLIQQCSRDVRMTGESVTNKSLRKLAVKILDIQPADTVLNCFSGYSTLMFNINDYARYIGYELNSNSYVISKMLMTMLGVHNFEVYNQDFLLCDTHEVAEKVFSDGPLNMRYDNPLVKNAPWAKDANTKDGNLLILYKVLDSIKENGTAVIAVPGKVLFSNHPSYVELRKRYLNSGLRAVISLPPLWSGTSINTNIMIVDKKYHGPVQFIDAQTLGTKDRTRNVVLSDEDLNRIYDAYEKQISVAGFSRLADQKEILEKETWQPGRYVEVETKLTTKSLEEIDNELDKLYASLHENLKK